MNKDTLTKTCASCGLQKPLSAFLQLTGAEGTTYGNICSTCRKTQQEHIELPTESEDSSSSSTGLKIDTKTETKRRSDEKDIRSKTEEQYHEERDKAEQKQTLQTQKKETIAKEQKTHRETFLDKSKEAKKRQISEEPKNILDERAEAEQRTDFVSPVIDTQFAGKIKRTQSATFNQFASWLPGSSPIAQTVKKAIKIGEQRQQQNPKENVELPKDAPDYVEKTMVPPKARGPRSR